ncbi:MAG: hypothetical protein RJB66_195 [Pseudomonadota bacterium]
MGLVFYFCIFFFSSHLLAAQVAFTYQGRITNPEGIPLKAPQVEFNLQIVGPLNLPKLCIMYSERFTIDMSSGDGGFSLLVGRGSRSDLSTFSLSRIFNSSLIYPPMPQCENGYVKQIGDPLYLKVTFNDGTGLQALPPLEISYTPYSIETSNVAGVPSNQVMRVDTSIAAPPLSFNNYAMNLTNFTDLLDLVSGQSTKYMKGLGSTTLNLASTSNNDSQITLIAPSTTFTSYQMSLPPNYGGNGQVLTSDGSGGTTWVSPPSSPWTQTGNTLSFEANGDNDRVGSVVRNTNTSNTESHAYIKARTELGGGNAFAVLGLQGLTNWQIGALRSENSLTIGRGGGDTDLTQGRFMTITGEGNVGIGTTSPTADLSINTSQTGWLGNGIYTAEIGNFSGASFADTGSYSGLNVAYANNPTNNQTGHRSALIGEIFTPANSTVNHGNLWGMIGQASTFGSGTTATLAGAWISASNKNASGTITTQYGIDVQGGNLGTITNSYGIYIGGFATGTRTNTPFDLYAADANAFNYFAGSVGIGTTAPRSGLDVSSTILGKASTINSTSTIDFSKGNIQHTTASCGSFSFWNLKDGGSYVFIVKGTTTGTCSFTAFSGEGTGSLTVHLPPGHGASTNGTHTMYNLLVSGSDVYLAWTPGY